MTPSTDADDFQRDIPALQTCNCISDSLTTPVRVHRDCAGGVVVSKLHCCAGEGSAFNHESRRSFIYGEVPLRALQADSAVTRFLLRRRFGSEAENWNSPSCVRPKKPEVDYTSRTYVHLYTYSTHNVLGLKFLSRVAFQCQIF